MSVEDKRITRQLEHELNRFQSLDISEAQLLVIHGTAYLGGILRPAIGMYSLNIKEEMRIFTEIAMKVPGIHGVTVDAKLEMSPRK
jgi:hypothetical protein